AEPSWCKAAGATRPTSSPMIARTTRSSSKVKPRCLSSMSAAHEAAPRADPGSPERSHRLLMGRVAILSWGLERSVDEYPLGRNGPAEATQILDANLMISLSPSRLAAQSRRAVLDRRAGLEL